MRTATRRAMVYGRRAAAADWWSVPGQTCVAAYKAIGATDLAASYVNLANPGTYNAAPGVAPTLSAGGWTFDGTQWLATGIAPTTLDWTLIVRFSGCSAALSALAGSYRSFSGRYPGMYIYNRVSAKVSYAQDSAISVSPAISDGILAVAGAYGYRNGAIDSTAISPYEYAANLQIYIGAHNFNSIAADILTGTIAAIAIYSTTLSAADVAALTARMAALA